MSIKAIGEEFAIGQTLVARRLKECDIRRSEQYDLPFSSSELRAMYVEGEMSIKAIAELFDLVQARVAAGLARCGVRQRSPVEQAKLAQQPKRYTPAVLKWLYEDMYFSTTQIAIAFGVDQSTADRWLQEQGVELRPVGYSEYHTRKRSGQPPKPIRSVNGYLMLRQPNHPRADSQGYVKLHQLAYERFYGAIPRGYVVHAIDGDHDNVSRANLRAMSNSEHSRFHCFANIQATGNAFKPCPKHLLPEYLAEWDERGG
jgi:hypothetical protein